MATVTSGLLLCSSAMAEAQISYFGTLGYAYMQGGTKLIEVSLDLKPVAENVEIIRITDGGFFPNYEMDDKQLKGDIISCSAKSSTNTEERHRRTLR